MAFPKASDMFAIANTTKEKWQEKARLLEKNRIIENIYDCAKCGNIFYEYIPDISITESDLQRNWLNEICYEFDTELNNLGYHTTITYFLTTDHIESILIFWDEEE